MLLKSCVSDGMAFAFNLFRRSENVKRQLFEKKITAFRKRQVENYMLL